MSNKGPKTFHLDDIWKEYVITAMADNPDRVVNRGVPMGEAGRNGKVQKTILMRKLALPKGGYQVVERMDYSLFRKILETYFEFAKEAVIDGKAVEFFHGVGKIAGQRVERDHSKKMVDFYRTKMQPKVWNEEKQKWMRKKIIYFVSDEYCSIAWYRMALIPNETVYEFQPTQYTRSGRGFTQQFSKAQVDNKLLKYKYIYNPLNSLKK